MQQVQNGEGLGADNVSCKHGNSCDFCHEEHGRPKHRGQRGRHALQRREYLENKHTEPLWFVALVDDLYKQPQEVVEEVKARLQNLRCPELQKVEKTMHVIEQIRDIGENAQHQRPDSMRLRGQRIAIPGNLTFSAAIAELDGRCKWLIGTLHLMIRKMKEPLTATKDDLDSLSPKENNIEQIQHIENTVGKILGRVADLLEQVDRPLHDPVAVRTARPEWLLNQVRNAASMARSLAESEEERQWLEGVIATIAMKEMSQLPEGDQGWNERVADQISETGNHCDMLPATISRTWKGILERCPTLEKLGCTIDDNFIEMFCEPVR